MQDDVVGRFLGQYELIELIGKGGMARIYKSIQPDLERYVAVKLLHPSVAADEEFLARFRREAKAIAILRHPHIVQIFDFGHQEELYYMVMEFIDGPTLRDELQRLKVSDETLPFSEVQRIVGEVSEALDYAHDRGIIHRDVKPSNILFTPEGQAVLSDFGLAFIIESPRQTITGFVGTPEYMAPEQGQSLAVDSRTDVYSLGVVLYEMLTSQVPFTAETPMGIVMKHISEPLPPPRSVNPDIPEGVEQVLLKAMSKDPQDRYRRAGELSRALAEAFEAAAVVEAPAAIPTAIPEEVSEVVEEPEEGLRCAKCGAELSPDTRFCGVCGAPVGERWQPPGPTAVPAIPIPEEIAKVVEEPEEGPRCAKCGAELSPDTRFCGVCGAPVGERWQPPAPPPPVVTPPPVSPPEPFIVPVEEQRPERSKLSLLVAVLGAGLLAVIVLAVIVVVAAIRGGGPSAGKPTVAGGVGGTVVSRASDTPSPTVVPTEAQPTATIAAISTPTVLAVPSPAPIQATPTPTRPTPTATPTVTPIPTPQPRPTTPVEMCFIGEVIRYDTINPGLIQIEGQVLNRDGEGVPDVLVRASAWSTELFTRTWIDGSYKIHGIGNAIPWEVDLPELSSVAATANIERNEQRAIVDFVEKPCP